MFPSVVDGYCINGLWTVQTPSQHPSRYRYTKKLLHGKEVARLANAISVAANFVKCVGGTSPWNRRVHQMEAHFPWGPPRPSLMALWLYLLVLFNPLARLETKNLHDHPSQKRQYTHLSLLTLRWHS